jgi:hypothetical protein
MHLNRRRTNRSPLYKQPPCSLATPSRIDGSVDGEVLPDEIVVQFLKSVID